MSSYRVYFTLKCGKFTDEEVYPEEFASYEEAYDKMCNLYFEEQKASCNHPSGIPKGGRYTRQAYQETTV